MTEAVSPDSTALISQMQGVLRQHLPQQAGELFAEILTTNDELQAKCAGYEEEIKSLREEITRREHDHCEAIETHEKTIRDQAAEMEKLIDKVEELKEWESRSKAVQDAEREVAMAVMRVKLEEAEKRAKEIRELSQMFAVGAKMAAGATTP